MTTDDPMFYTTMVDAAAVIVTKLDDPIHRVCYMTQLARLNELFGFVPDWGSFVADVQYNALHDWSVNFNDTDEWTVSEEDPDGIYARGAED